MRQSGQNASEVCAAEETRVIDIKDAESGVIKKDRILKVLAFQAL
jgi:hypothetical protein